MRIPKDLYITICNNIITKMNNVKILIYLLNHREQKFTINKIAKALEINYRTAYDETKKLQKENLISIEKAGNSNLCSLTDNFNERIFAAEYERRQILFKKNKDFMIIHDRFAELRDTFILLLFGSYAKRTANKHSDIDLLAIGGNEKQLAETADLIPRNIHLTTVTIKSFITMVMSKQFSVGSEAIKNNIIFIGIEDYYRLIENAY